MNRSQLSTMERTKIKDKLLKALILGADTNFKNIKLDGFINNGHSRDSFERQVLSLILKKALNIIRVPWQDDFIFDNKYKNNLTSLELEESIKEARRIYEHTQGEFSKLGLKTVTVNLKRGISGDEAIIINSLIDSIKEDEIPFYFQTLTFFNCTTSPHSRDISIEMECPIEWIWACAFTLNELSGHENIDDEFIVTCLNLDGILNISKSKILVSPTFDKSVKVEPQKKYHDKAMYLSLLATNQLKQDGMVIINREVHYCLGFIIKILPKCLRRTVIARKIIETKRIKCNF